MGHSFSALRLQGGSLERSKGVAQWHSLHEALDLDLQHYRKVRKKQVGKTLSLPVAGPGDAGL